MLGAVKRVFGRHIRRTSRRLVCTTVAFSGGGVAIPRKHPPNSNWLRYAPPVKQNEKTKEKEAGKRIRTKWALNAFGGREASLGRPLRRRKTNELRWDSGEETTTTAENSNESDIMYVYVNGRNLEDITTGTRPLMRPLFVPFYPGRGELRDDDVRRKSGRRRWLVCPISWLLIKTEIACCYANDV